VKKWARFRSAVTLARLLGTFSNQHLKILVHSVCGESSCCACGV